MEELVFDDVTVVEPEEPDFLDVEKLGHHYDCGGIVHKITVERSGFRRCSACGEQGVFVRLMHEAPVTGRGREGNA